MSTNIPSELKYISSHEWVRQEADGSLTVGITDHAQALLGDVVYVELPAVGIVLAFEAQAGVVESVKAASDVYSPLAGTIVAVNDDLANDTAVINTDPYGAGWFFRIQTDDADAFANLLTAKEYAELIGQ